jgi:hypothetical protein
MISMMVGRAIGTASVAVSQSAQFRFIPLRCRSRFGDHLIAYAIEFFGTLLEY